MTRNQAERIKHAIVGWREEGQFTPEEAVELVAAVEDSVFEFQIAPPAPPAPSRTLTPTFADDVPTIDVPRETLEQIVGRSRCATRDL